MTLDVQTGDLVTKDKINVKVKAAIRFKVIDPISATMGKDSYITATLDATREALTNLIINSESKELTQRLGLSTKLKDRIDEETREWGIEIIEVKIQQPDS